MLDLQGGLFLVLSIGLFAVKGFAMADCVGRRASDFGHDTLSKNAWLVLLGLALVAHILQWNPLAILNLLGTVAALVYLAQVRGSSH